MLLISLLLLGASTKATELVEMTVNVKDFDKEYIGSSKPELVRDGKNYLFSTETIVNKEIGDCVAYLDIDREGTSKYKALNFNFQIPCCEYFEESNTKLLLADDTLPKCNAQEQAPAGKYVIKAASLDEFFDSSMYMPGHWTMVYRLQTNDKPILVINYDSIVKE